VQALSHTKYVGIVPSLKKIWLEEGVSGLFKGNGINVLRIAPYSGAQFVSYEWIKKVLSKVVLLISVLFMLLDQHLGAENEDSSVAKRFAAGGMSGAIAVILTYPLDMIHARLAVASSLSTASATTFKPTPTFSPPPGITFKIRANPRVTYQKFAYSNTVPSRSPGFTSKALEVATGILRTEGGFLSFYRGLSPSLLVSPRVLGAPLPV
jgi:solute carrier family 25 phosphate transporter 23/24/25/41